MRRSQEHLDYQPNELSLFIQKEIGIVLSGLPDLSEIFSKKSDLQRINGPHTGLISSDNLMATPKDPFVGLWLQGIDPSIENNSGRIAEHSHETEKVDEIIILDKNSCYAGLKYCIGTIAGHDFFWVPAGIVHGSNTKPSFGRWISIKISSLL